MSKRDKHNGLSSYTNDEADNVVLAQNGFDILVGIATTDGKEHIAGSGADVLGVKYFKDVEYWVAMKAIAVGAVVDSSVIAESIVGDDFMLRPGLGYYSTGSGDNVDLQGDDIVVGCFKKIRICDAVSYIKAYRG